MKKIIFIILFAAQLIPLNTYCAESEIFNKINLAINSSLPEKWNVLSVEYNIVPQWSFSEDKCWLIKVFGPNMSGRKYYDENGRFIGEKKIYNESIFIWVGDEDFNPELSLLNRIKNCFSIVPQEIPIKIFEYSGFTIYAKEGLITLPDNEQFEKNLIQGTHSSKYWEFENRRSWSTWADDLENNLEEYFSAKRE